MSTHAQKLSRMRRYYYAHKAAIIAKNRYFPELLKTPYKPLS